MTVWNNLPGGSHEHIRAIARQTPRRRFWCTWTYVTRSGQIVAAGDDKKPSGMLPVVGGTGAYAGVCGTATDQLGLHGGRSPSAP